MAMENFEYLVLVFRKQFSIYCIHITLPFWYCNCIISLARAEMNFERTCSVDPDLAMPMAVATRYAHVAGWVASSVHVAEAEVLQGHFCLN